MLLDIFLYIIYIHTGTELDILMGGGHFYFILFFLSKD